MNLLNMRFSSVELRDLAKAWVVISLSFAMLRGGGLHFTPAFVISAIISAVTVGVGFLLHELMHKYFAQKYGCRAEFRAFDIMLLIAFGLALSRSPIFFAAPGAVFISGNANLARSGRISAAGPVTNIVLAAAFIAVAFAARFFPAPALLLQVASYGASINAWLAVFNMLPFMGLDGSKVMYWNMKVYASLLALSILMMVLAAVV